jgi:putative transcriptional regulator
MIKLGNNLRRLRFEEGELSQEKLAKEVGVTRQTIISIEKGNYVPSSLLGLKLARFFRKPFEEVFFLVEEQNDKGGKS